MRQKIKKILKEALGVPEGLMDATNIISDLFYKEVMSKSDDDDYEELQFSFPNEIDILDYHIDEINFTMNIHKTDKVTEPTFLGMGRYGKSMTNPAYPRVEHKFSPDFFVDLDIAIPEDANFGDVKNFLLKNKKRINSSISHEIKHDFDFFKKGVESPKERAVYTFYSNMRFNLPPLDKFLHNCYFIAVSENLVRPSEISYLINHDEVTRENFLEFLQSTEVYQRLKEIQNFTLENFKKELEQYDAQMIEGIESVDLDVPEDLNERINVFLYVIWKTIQNTKVEVLEGLLYSSPLLNLVSNAMGSNKNQQYLRRFINEVAKYNTAQEFFKAEEKKFKIVSTKMIKKLSKLYAITKPSSEQKNESIVEWELYHKIKKTPVTKYVKEFSYKKK